MLKVPELKPGQQAFDPDFDYQMHPGIKAADHFLPVSGGGAPAADQGAILMGLQHQLDEETRLRSKRSDPEYREALAARDQLDHAVVKDAVTSLHREDDEQMRALAAYAGPRIGDIVKDHDAFIRAQEAKYNAALADDRQRRLFQNVTREYFKQAPARARALRNHKVREFRDEVIERQNREFVDRALRPENVFDDLAQTRYRDMILFNLENLHADLPDAQRQARLDAAGAALYRKILDRRLEVDPSRLAALLDAPAVKRVLGDDGIREYRDKAAAAVRDLELETTAREWVADELDPAAARLLADGDYPDRAERDAVLEHYAYWRANDGQKKYLTFILNAANAWRALADGSYRREALPAWVRRNHPELAAFLLDHLREWERGGGRAPEPEYAYLLDFVDGFDPGEAAELLREEAGVYTCMRRLGGPDADAFQIALRLLLGKIGDADRCFLEDLRLAAEMREPAEEGEDGRQGAEEYLRRFVRARRVALERGEHAALTAAEVRALVS